MDREKHKSITIPDGTELIEFCQIHLISGNNLFCCTEERRKPQMPSNLHHICVEAQEVERGFPKPPREIPSARNTRRVNKRMPAMLIAPRLSCQKPSLARWSNYFHSPETPLSSAAVTKGIGRKTQACTPAGPLKQTQEPMPRPEPLTRARDRDQTPWT
jgi:hypothetical protein